jgi:hypothetical protein
MLIVCLLLTWTYNEAGKIRPPARNCNGDALSDCGAFASQAARPGEPATRTRPPPIQQAGSAALQDVVEAAAQPVSADCATHVQVARSIKRLALPSSSSLAS